MPQTLFLDTEFTGLFQHSSLISLALVGADRTFYAEFSDYPSEQLTDWHEEHVISKLLYNQHENIQEKQGPDWRLKDTSSIIAEQLRLFLQSFTEVVIWSDVLAYDWVLFCELFGGARELPKVIHYIPGDLSTLLRVKGFDPDVPRDSLVDPEDLQSLTQLGLEKHNALYDAHLMSLIYTKLNQSVT